MLILLNIEFGPEAGTYVAHGAYVAHVGLFTFRIKYVKTSNLTIFFRWAGPEMRIRTPDTV
jgi:hypothetical protein